MSCWSSRLALGLGMFVACGGARAPAGGEGGGEAAVPPRDAPARASAAGSAKPAAGELASAAPVWRRLTPRGSVGQPNVSELAMLHEEWIGAGFGAFRS